MGARALVWKYDAAFSTTGTNAHGSGHRPGVRVGVRIRWIYSRRVYFFGSVLFLRGLPLYGH